MKVFAKCNLESGKFKIVLEEKLDILMVILLIIFSKTQLYELCLLDTMADEHFAPQIIFLPGTICIPTHFSKKFSILKNIYSTHFTPWHTLLLSPLWSLAHFLITLLHSKEQRTLRRTIYKLAKCSREQSVPRSRVF